MVPFWVTQLQIIRKYSFVACFLEVGPNWGRAGGVN